MEPRVKPGLAEFSIPTESPKRFICWLLRASRGIIFRMEGDRRCPKCGQLIPRGEADCPHCRVENSPANYTPQAVLLLCLLGLVVLFVTTGFTVRAFHAKQQQLGQEFFGRGEAELKAGQPEKAIVDFRTALIYSRDNDLYQLHLAQALMAANHTEEARSYLSDLWEREPESAEVNLELGRLAARAGDINQALRYYHSAVYGEWEGPNISEQRRQARLELYHFLVRRGANGQAEAELEALAAELPADDAILHTQVGDLFLKSGQFDRALREYLAALNGDKNQKEALAGAGEADFRLGNYRYAWPYLRRALNEDPGNTELAQMLEMAKLILSIDPYAAELTSAERNVRVLRAFDQGVSRVQLCARQRGESLEEMPGKSAGKWPTESQVPPQSQSSLQRLYVQAMKMKPRMKPSVLSRDPDLATEALDWVREAESLTSSVCGEPTGLDEAIVLVERKYGGIQK